MNSETEKPNVQPQETDEAPAINPACLACELHPTSCQGAAPDKTVAGCIELPDAQPSIAEPPTTSSKSPAPANPHGAFATYWPPHRLRQFGFTQ